MANSAIHYNIENIRGEDKLSIFWDMQYVNEFYLNWPSLGMKSSKAIIPTQIINSLGLAYSFYKDTYHINFECNNVFDKQTYDNYLIQKPGRAFSLKFRLSFY